MAKTVMAYIELQDGEPRKVALQALGEARRIADVWNTSVEAIVVGGSDTLADSTTTLRSPVATATKS